MIVLYFISSRLRDSKYSTCVYEFFSSRDLKTVNYPGLPPRRHEDKFNRMERRHEAERLRRTKETHYVEKSCYFLKVDEFERFFNVDVGRSVIARLHYL